MRFRGLLQFERKYNLSGPLEWEWDTFGQDPRRTSPIYNLRLGEMLPVILAIGHLASLGGGLTLIAAAELFM